MTKAINNMTPREYKRYYNNKKLKNFRQLVTNKFGEDRGFMTRAANELGITLPKVSALLKGSSYTVPAGSIEQLEALPNYERPAFALPIEAIRPTLDDWNVTLSASISVVSQLSAVIQHHNPDKNVKLDLASPKIMAKAFAYLVTQEFRRLNLTLPPEKVFGQRETIPAFVELVEDPLG